MLHPCAGIALLIEIMVFATTPCAALGKDEPSNWVTDELLGAPVGGLGGLVSLLLETGAKHACTPATSEYPGNVNPALPALEAISLTLLYLYLDL